MSLETPNLCLNKTHGFPLDSSIDPAGVAGRFDFKSRDSSTGGKVPIHGPRRMVSPSRYYGDDFDNLQDKFKVSKSEIANYKAIYALSKQVIACFFVIDSAPVYFLVFYVTNPFLSILIFLVRMLCILEVFVVHTGLLENL